MSVAGHRVRAAKAADGMKIRRAAKLVWVQLPPPAPMFSDFCRLAAKKTSTKPRCINEPFSRQVYLHAGTRLGACALGLGASTALAVSESPRELRVLKPHEVEDVLCIFKDELKARATTAAAAEIFKRSWCNS